MIQMRIGKDTAKRDAKYSKQFKRFIKNEISPSDYWKMNCAVIKNIIDKSNSK